MVMPSLVEDSLVGVVTLSTKSPMAGTSTVVTESSLLIVFLTLPLRLVSFPVAVIRGGSDVYLLELQRHFWYSLLSGYQGVLSLQKAFDL